MDDITNKTDKTPLDCQIIFKPDLYKSGLNIVLEVNDSHIAYKNGENPCEQYAIRGYLGESPDGIQSIYSWLISRPATSLVLIVPDGKLNCPENVALVYLLVAVLLKKMRLTKAIEYMYNRGFTLSNSRYLDVVDFIRAKISENERAVLNIPAYPIDQPKKPSAAFALASREIPPLDRMEMLLREYTLTSLLEVEESSTDVLIQQIASLMDILTDAQLKEVIRRIYPLQSRNGEFVDSLVHHYRSFFQRE